MKTLKEFLKNNQACEDGFHFAKDLTLEQFLKTCQRGDWILWLFATMNPESLRELTLAKGHCANTVRDLMKDERSTKAVDVAIAFGEGKATGEELAYAADASADAAAPYASADAAADAAAPYASAYAFAAAAAAAAYAADASAFAAAAADYASSAAADAAYAAAAYASAFAAYAFAAADAAASSAADAAGYAAAASAAANAKKQNQKLTADICRKYLPLEIWNQNLI